MMDRLPLLDELTDSLRCLPGVGPKWAQRMAFHLLQRDRKGANRLAAAVQEALERLLHCEKCNTFSDVPICHRCQSSKRDHSLLCIVETPVDMQMMEQTHAFSGLYYVLMGRISPLDGIGPSDLEFSRLVKRVQDGEVKEVILATNYTNEGEVTAHFIAELMSAQGMRVTRLARGVPVGGELEFVDPGTLAQAFRERKKMSE